MDGVPKLSTWPAETNCKAPGRCCSPHLVHLNATDLHQLSLDMDAKVLGNSQADWKVTTAESSEVSDHQKPLLNTCCMLGLGNADVNHPESRGSLSKRGRETRTTRQKARGGECCGGGVRYV